MDAFVANSLALLTLERDAEVERSEGLVSSGRLQSVKELEAKGVCLQKLEVGCLQQHSLGRLQGYVMCLCRR